MSRVDGFSNYQPAYPTMKQDAKVSNDVKNVNEVKTPIEEHAEYHAFIPASDEVSLLESVTGLQWENKSDIFMPICVSTFDYSV